MKAAAKWRVGVRILATRILAARTARSRSAVATSSLAIALMAVVIFAAILTTGCASGGEKKAASTTTTLDALMQAYYVAHPGYVDVSLYPIASTPAQTVAAIKKDLDSGREIRLPSYLPQGFALAAPYNSDGSGNVYPNPYAWGRGYSVTYTDGKGFIMVFENSDDDLSQGTWAALEETLAGRHLRIQSVPGLTLVATVDDGKTPFLVSGGDFGGGALASELTKVAVSLDLQ